MKILTKDMKIEKKMTDVQWNMKIFFLPPNCEIIFGSLSKCDSKIGLFSFASHKVISLPTLQYKTVCS